MHGWWRLCNRSVHLKKNIYIYIFFYFILNKHCRLSWKLSPLFLSRKHHPKFVVSFLPMIWCHYYMHPPNNKYSYHLKFYMNSIGQKDLTNYFYFYFNVVTQLLNIVIWKTSSIILTWNGIQLCECIIIYFPFPDWWPFIITPIHFSRSWRNRSENLATPQVKVEGNQTLWPHNISVINFLKHISDKFKI